MFMEGKKMMKRFNIETANEYRRILEARELAVDVSPELILIAEKQARASHEGWLAGKRAQGYVYGPETNDNPEKGPLTNPNMVSFDELDENTKKSNISNAVAVIKILRTKNVTFVDFLECILHPIAKEIHDEWCKEKFAAGWTWGEKTDKAKKIHRDLVPFEVLLSTPELRGDVQYDIDTARQILIALIKDANVFPVISSLEAFSLA